MILITGVAGFIGRALCDFFLAQGNCVLGIDNFITSEPKLNNSSQFYFLSMAVEDPQLSEKIKDFPIRQIFHLACPTGTKNLITLSEEMLSANAIGTINIFEIAKKRNVPCLYASSSEVYGNPLHTPQDEKYTGNVNPIGLRSPYEEGKRFSEALSAMYVRKYGVDIKIARIFNTYGPKYCSKDPRVIPQFVFAAKKNHDLIVYGNGKQKRTFLYIDDLISGLQLIMQKGKPLEIFNLGSDQEIEIMKLAKLVIKLANSNSQIAFEASIVPDHAARKPALDKIRYLGWKQTIYLEEGILKTLKNY